MYKILTRLHTLKPGVFRFHMIQNDQGEWVEYIADSLDEVELEAIKILERVGALDLKVVQEEPYYVDVRYSEDEDFNPDNEEARALALLNYIGWGDLKISDNKPYTVDLHWGVREEEKKEKYYIDITSPIVCQFEPRYMDGIVEGSSRSTTITFIQPVDSFHLIINGEEVEGLPSWIEYMSLSDTQGVLTFKGITQNYDIEVVVDGDFDADMTSIDEDGNIYHSITEAIQQSNSTIKLLADEEINEPISSDKDINIDLMGYGLIGDVDGQVFSLTDKGTGATHNINITNSSSHEGLILGGVDVVSSGDNYRVNIGKNVRILAANPLYFRGTGEEEQYICNLEGILEATPDSGYAVFQGNGNAGKGGSVLNIKGGQLIHPNGEAIYQPQNGVINIYDGLIEGNTAIAMKRGTLNMYGGTIHAIGNYYDPAEANNNGSEHTGAAISLISHDGYLGSMEINIEGGDIISDYGYGLYEGIPVNNGKPASEDSHIKHINITGGRFYGEEGALEIQKTRDCDITGGKYNTNIDKFVKTPYEVCVNYDTDRHNYPFTVEELS